MQSCTTDLEMTEHPTNSKEIITVSRRILVQITGSMKQFEEQGKQAATWSPINAKVGDVFGVHDIFETTPDQGTTSAVLQSAVIHKICLLEQKNDFPVHLGVNISCITPEETTRSGHKYAVTAMAKTHMTHPLLVYEAGDQQEGLEWRSRYPEYNTSNLEKVGVLPVTGQQFIFCSKNHPAIEVLRQNKDLINNDIDSQPLIDDEWYKIMKPVFSTCCEALKKKILAKVATRDLNNFEVQISRVGRDTWTSSTVHQQDELLQAVSIEGDANTDKASVVRSMQELTRRNYTYSARLEVTYEVAV